MTAKPTHDIALAIVQRDDRWLVARRPAHAVLGGFWEFPGGKCSLDEPPIAAALRELREECAVDADALELWPAIEHEYADRCVRLFPVLCRWRAGEAQARAADECAWVTADELAALEMPPANETLVQRLRAL